MDFVAEEFSHGGKSHILTVVDVFTRDALGIHAGHRLKGEQVADVLNRLARRPGAPKAIFVDNGREFTGRLMDMGAHHHGVRLDFSRPGKPTDHSFVETFNGSLPDDCLDAHWLASLAETQGLLEAWRQHHYESRTHSAVNNLPPAEYARRILEMGPA